MNGLSRDDPRTSHRPAPGWAELPLASGAAARAAALALTNPVHFDVGTNVLAQAEGHAASDPQRAAIVDDGRVLSYGLLIDRVGELASTMRASGCAAGDIVACRGPRCGLTALLALALERIGAVYLPIDTGWPSARVTEIVRASGSAFLMEYQAGDVVAADYDLRITALSAGAGHLEPNSAPGRQLAYVIYTSGTTGRPKGAMIEQAGMLNHLRAKVADLSLSALDRVAFTAPLVFDISIWQMLAPFVAGAAIVVARDNDIAFPPRFRRLLIKHDVTVVELVPTAIGMLLDDAERVGAAETLPRLRWLICTGEELRPSLARRVMSALPHAKLLNAYGPTECSDDVTHHVVTAGDLDDQRLPIGRPIGNAAIYILVRQEAAGVWRAAEHGEVGELFVGGLPVGLGYLGSAEETASAFFADRIDPASPTERLYRTGDLARIDGGKVHYLGRLDRQVKISGIRLELDEVEAVLSRHPAVRQCAVTVGEENGRQHLVAHCVSRVALGVDQIASYLKTVLPVHAVPNRWTWHEQLPLTINGKIDYRALAAGVPQEAIGGAEEW